MRAVLLASIAGTAFAESRCSRSRAEAIAICGRRCLSDSMCPPYMYCWFGLPPCGRFNSRCGKSRQEAINNGTVPCDSDEQCADGKRCYTNSTADSSVDPVPAVSVATSSRCGTSWGDATTKCGTDCVNNDAICPQSEHCFAGLAPCSSSATPNSNRCGRSWSDANFRCGTSCWHHDSACPTGETCYADLSPCE